MERETLLCVLSTACFGATMWAAAAVTDGLPLPLAMSSRFATSRQGAWWRLVAPVLTGLTAVAFLLGWALQEPDPADEWAGDLAWASATWVALVGLRALWRAWQALADRHLDKGSIAAVGFLRRRVVVSPGFAEEAEPAVMHAALAHEAAHGRAHDPLRIWLAQWLADLQWPFPGARRRLGAWLLALEMQRDDEAIRAGASPTALAEAIVLAARLAAHSSWQQGARAAGDGSGIRRRVCRLLDPTRLPCGAGCHAPRAPLVLGYATCLAASVWLGFAHGEGILRWLLGVSR